MPPLERKIRRVAPKVKGSKKGERRRCLPARFKARRDFGTKEARTRYQRAKTITCKGKAGLWREMENENQRAGWRKPMIIIS